MAFNCSDTRQRAYNRIDTSAPGGSWIDEKQYNKSLGGSAKGRKTLVGNWQEEAQLEGDMLTHGHDLSLIRKDGKFFKGGYESTAYLLSSEDPAAQKFDPHTTQRTSFNSTNGDVSHRLAPVGGIRQQLKAREVIEEARQMVAQQAAPKPEALTSTYRSTISENTPVTASAMATLSQRSLPRISDKQFSPSEAPYAHDRPITLYTGNPATGKTMTVHGKTSAQGANPLGRSNFFTFDKFAIGSL
jgi:hypothetical protein